MKKLFIAVSLVGSAAFTAGSVTGFSDQPTQQPLSLEEIVLVEEIEHESFEIVRSVHRNTPSHVAHRNTPSHVAHRNTPSHVAHRNTPSHVAHRNTRSHVAHRNTRAHSRNRTRLGAIQPHLPTVQIALASVD